MMYFLLCAVLLSLIGGILGTIAFVDSVPSSRLRASNYKRPEKSDTTWSIPTVDRVREMLDNNVVRLSRVEGANGPGTVLLDNNWSVPTVRRVRQMLDEMVTLEQYDLLLDYLNAEYLAAKTIDQPARIVKRGKRG